MEAEPSLRRCGILSQRDALTDEQRRAEEQSVQQ
jgi:hypothetical protein